MAIKKSISTKFGVDVDYWKISKIEINETKEKLYSRVVISGYTSKEASLKTEPLGEIVYVWRGEDSPYSGALSGNLKKIAYAKIMASVLVVNPETNIPEETNPFVTGAEV